MRVGFRLVFPPLSVGSALLEVTPLKTVSSCSLLISPSLPSSCLLSMASSSCPTENNSEEISSTQTLSHPTPPTQLHTTNKPQHKRFTDADVAYRHAGHTCSCERWAVSTHIWEDWGKIKYRRHYTKKSVLVNSKGIKHGDRHIKCRF